MVNFKALVLPVLSLLATVGASSVLDLSESNFDDTVFSGTPSLVEFFAPWCGHCKRLAPIYDELADNFQHAKKKVNIAKVDGDAHPSLSTKYGISGFPTIKYFDGKSKDPVDYKSGRDLESLQSYITEQTGVKPKKSAQAPSDVEFLTDKTFDKAIGGDKDVFVAFTAPWCGHCKTLAPTWETLAHSYAPDKEGLTIAKVDADTYKSVGSAQGVSSYPTIKFFPKGSTEPLNYSGGRDEKSLMEFVNENAGTHRVSGGGLDAVAGTVAALDSIAAKYTGNNVDELVTELKAAAEGLKDKYAEYYVKTLEKLESNAAHLQKETGRLEGILKKGGLARSKEDDIKSRLNVLRRFGASDETVEKLKDATDETASKIKQEL